MKKSIIATVMERSTVTLRPSKGDLMNHLRSTSGLALLFSIIIVTIMMVIAGTMSASLLRSFDNNLNIFRSIQAYYASRASMEKALADAAAQGIGYENSSDTAIFWDTNSDGIDDVTGTYEIFSQSKPLDWRSTTGDGSCDTGDECYIPIPGTGDAGTDCDFEDTDAEWAVGTNAADDECNWNRIGYGETVTIPLFYTDPDTGELVNSYVTSYEDFILRVRTPIDPDSLTGERYLLDDSENEVVMSWEFNGTCNDGSDYTCYLVPMTTKGKETFIYDSTINNASDNIVINIQGRYEINSGTDDQKFDISIKEFITATSPEYTYIINQPYFKITIPQSLIASDGITSIPYLEYQLITDIPISDNKIVYISDGKAVGRHETYVRHMQATQSIENNSIINFVIQN